MSAIQNVRNSTGTSEKAIISPRALADTPKAGSIEQPAAVAHRPSGSRSHKGSEQTSSQTAKPQRKADPVANWPSNGPAIKIGTVAAKITSPINACACFRSQSERARARARVPSSAQATGPQAYVCVAGQSPESKTA